MPYSKFIKIIRNGTFYFVVLFCAQFLTAPFVHSQEPQAEQLLKEAREDVKMLASAKFAGRGYQDGGHKRAADFIASHFEEYGLKGIKEELGWAKYFQEFKIPLNKIDSADLVINGERLRIGHDFIVNSSSGGHSAKGRIQNLGYGLPYEYKKARVRIAVMKEGVPEKVKKKPDLKEKYLEFGNPQAKVNLATKVNLPAVILLKKKLTAGLSRMPYEIPVIEVLESSWPKKAKTAEIFVEREFKSIQSQNVIGFVEGKLDPEQVIIVSAHYDHLGRQGEAIFYGANDNASGIAMLLSMAKHYAQPENQPDYTMVFIGFGGEEAGLVGSRHYVARDPIFPLNKTRFILNLDLMGNGDEGITAVAGLDFEDKFNLLKEVNDSLKAVPVVKGRRNAPNSDHYFFINEGVEGFFIYTLGGPPHYHDVYDTPEELRFSRFVEVRELCIAFLDRL